MTSDVQTLSGRPGSHHPKRRWRNYLLVPSFQLKYTAMVVGVTVIVASVLGVVAYRYSQGQTEVLTAKRLETEGDAVSAELVEDLRRYGEEADRTVATSIVVGVLLLALALGATGIVVTHRLVGPAYRLKMLLREVRDGRLVLPGRLRKKDELQDIFVAFSEMLVSLRAAKEQEIGLLEAAIERARAAGVPADAILDIEQLRDRVRASLDGS